ncbi:hypothetical protein P7K49_017036 [Saguinus oedipus]|uniref:Uncharacterized protein n=1 Tax=Saguinus oedipus TaxID=9490 RepID=A0ABQ9V230_SAGOE|nr:hypothetical protein P7K49_017036 [Saguinus oedipus]
MPCTWEPKASSGRPRTQPPILQLLDFSLQNESRTPGRKHSLEAQERSQMCFKELTHEVGDFTERCLIGETKQNDAFAKENPTNLKVTALGSHKNGRLLWAQPCRLSFFPSWVSAGFSSILESQSAAPNHSFPKQGPHWAPKAFPKVPREIE